MAGENSQHEALENGVDATHDGIEIRGDRADKRMMYAIGVCLNCAAEGNDGYIIAAAQATAGRGFIFGLGGVDTFVRMRQQNGCAGHKMIIQLSRDDSFDVIVPNFADGGRRNLLSHEEATLVRITLGELIKDC